MAKNRETTNQDRDAIANGKIRRNFGLIFALIDHPNKRVEFCFSPRKKDPLSNGHQERCLLWALDSLADLRAAGYIFTQPEAAR